MLHVLLRRLESFLMAAIPFGGPVRKLEYGWNHRRATQWTPAYDATCDTLIAFHYLSISSDAIKYISHDQ